MFSKTCEYAIKAILHVALNSTEEKKIGLREIAEELDLPSHFLGKIMQNLVKHNLLLSSKGPKGGFYCDIKAQDIPIMKIIEIIDGTAAFKKCGLGLKECSDSHPCPIHNEFKPYRTKLKKLLAKKTIKDFALIVKNGEAFLSN